MKNRLRITLLAFALISPAFVPAYAHDTACQTEDGVAKQQVQQAIDTWIDAVNSRQSEAVASLYEENAVLLPTLSPKVANTPLLRKGYFDKFTAHPGLIGMVNEEHIRIYGDIAINSGLYTFTYDKDGQTVIVPARFSFVYHKTPQGWMIIDHHSSKLPVE